MLFYATIQKYSVQIENRLHHDDIMMTSLTKLTKNETADCVSCYPYVLVGPQDMDFSVEGRREGGKEGRRERRKEGGKEEGEKEGRREGGGRVTVTKSQNGV